MKAKLAQKTYDIGFADGKKAGMENGDKMAYEIGKGDGISDGIAEGMRTVIEWLERAKKIKVPKYQLKEWGL